MKLNTLSPYETVSYRAIQTGTSTITIPKSLILEARAELILLAMDEMPRLSLNEADYVVHGMCSEISRILGKVLKMLVITGFVSCGSYAMPVYAAQEAFQEEKSTITVEVQNYVTVDEDGLCYLDDQIVNCETLEPETKQEED